MKFVSNFRQRVCNESDIALGTERHSIPYFSPTCFMECGTVHSILYSLARIVLSTSRAARTPRVFQWHPENDKIFIDFRGCLSTGERCVAELLSRNVKWEKYVQVYIYWPYVIHVIKCDYARWQKDNVDLTVCEWWTLSGGVGLCDCVRAMAMAYCHTIRIRRGVYDDRIQKHVLTDAHITLTEKGALCRAAHLPTFLIMLFFANDRAAKCPHRSRVHCAHSIWYSIKKFHWRIWWTEMTGLFVRIFFSLFLLFRGENTRTNIYMYIVYVRTYLYPVFVDDVVCWRKDGRTVVWLRSHWAHGGDLWQN